MSGIFISYRRDDAGGYVGRLSKDLEHRLRGDKVFFDIDDIKIGDNFVSAIEEALDECYVFLPIIGKDWLDIEDASGNRRLDYADDFVRLEISTALRRTDVRVIPILAGGASMPGSAQLPEDIKALAQRNALKITNQSWDYDVDKLFNAILQAMGVSQSFGELPGEIDLKYIGEWIERPTISCSLCGAEILGSSENQTELCLICSRRSKWSSNIKKIANPAFIRSAQIPPDESIIQLRQLLSESMLAPDDFKQLELEEELLKLVFVPHWCFRVDADSEYSGKKGTRYTVKEPRKVAKDGEEVVEIASVSRVDWHGVFGSIDETFDFCAGASMSSIKNAHTDFDHEELSVHRTSDYAADSVVMATQVAIEDAFIECKNYINEKIEKIAKEEISGDESEVDKIRTIYRSVTSKLILLPRWHYIASYGNDGYLLTVDGLTGCADGDIPTSKVKAGLAITSAIIIIGIFAFTIYYIFFS